MVPAAALPLASDPQGRVQAVRPRPTLPRQPEWWTGTNDKCCWRDQWTTSNAFVAGDHPPPPSLLHTNVQRKGEEGTQASSLHSLPPGALQVSVTPIPPCTLALYFGDAVEGKGMTGVQPQPYGKLVDAYLGRVAA